MTYGTKQVLLWFAMSGLFTLLFLQVQPGLFHHLLAGFSAVGIALGASFKTRLELE